MNIEYRYYNNCPWFPVCPLKRFTEQEKLPKYWTEQYCKGEYKKCFRYKMVERGKYTPDNMLPDGHIDKKLK